MECIRLQRQVEEGTAINERLCVYLGNVLIQYMDFRDLLTKLVEEAKGGDKPLNYYEMLPRWVGLMKHRLALNATTGDVKALNYELKRMKGEKTS